MKKKKSNSLFVLNIQARVQFRQVYMSLVNMRCFYRHYFNKINRKQSALSLETLYTVRLHSVPKYLSLQLHTNNHVTGSAHSVGSLSTKHMKAGDYRPASEMPFKWRFAGGPIVARDKVLAGF